MDAEIEHEDDKGMVQVGLKVPSELLREVDARVKAGHFGTRTEYVRHLLRKAVAEEYEGHSTAEVRA